MRGLPAFGILDDWDDCGVAALEVDGEEAALVTKKSIDEVLRVQAVAGVLKAEVAVGT